MQAYTRAAVYSDSVVAMDGWVTDVKTSTQATPRAAWEEGMALA